MLAINFVHCSPRYGIVVGRFILEQHSLIIQVSSVNISRHPRTCLVLPTVTVIFILTHYVLFIIIALHTMVTCLTLFQIIYTRHYVPHSCTSSPQCLSIHWGVRPLSLFYLFPYLLAVVPHYSTLVPYQSLLFYRLLLNTSSMPRCWYLFMRM